MLSTPSQLRVLWYDILQYYCHLCRCMPPLCGYLFWCVASPLYPNTAKRAFQFCKSRPLFDVFLTHSEKRGFVMVKGATLMCFSPFACVNHLTIVQQPNPPLYNITTIPLSSYLCIIVDLFSVVSKICTCDGLGNTISIAQWSLVQCPWPCTTMIFTTIAVPPCIMHEYFWDDLLKTWCVVLRTVKPRLQAFFQLHDS